MKEDKYLFSNCMLFNGQLFFIEFHTGLPALMNPENGDINYCGVIQGYMLPSGDFANYIGSYGEKIYILEHSGKNLVILDLQKNECQYRELSCNFFSWENYAAFEQYEDNYYIFPKYGNDIFIVNMKNNEITRIEECLCEIGEPRCCCRAGDKVWILPEGKSIIGAFDLTCKVMECYELKERIENLVDAIYIDENIYFLNWFGCIYKWDLIQKQIEIIETLKTEPDDTKSVSKIIYAGNKLIVFPSLGEDINILDVSTYERKTYQGYPSDFMYQEKKWSKFYGCCEDDRYFYFAMRSANYVLKVDKQSGEFIWLKPNLPTSETIQKVQSLFLKENARIKLIMGKTHFSEKTLKITELIKMDLKGNGNKRSTLVGSKIYEEINNLNER